MTVKNETAMHTAGPWRATGTGIEARAFDGSWKWITPVVHGGTPEQATANRSLMVAAPDLLEAVRAGGRYSDALRRYQGHGVLGEVIPGTDELDALFMEWHDKGHAAIAKAEGR